MREDMPSHGPIGGASRIGEAFRIGAALVVALVGFVLAAVPYPTTISGWLGWIGVAVLAGAVAGRARHVWVLWVALLVIAVLAPSMGWADDLRAYWWLSATFAVAVPSIAFVAGTAITWKPGAGVAVRRRWTGIGRTGRRLAAGAAVVAILGFAGYGGYGFVAGGAQYVEAVPNPGPCDNPGQRFGWAFEPINYDASNEPTALDPSAAAKLCTDQGPPAGTDVVASDGIHIAGWYIPAASGADPAGPTVVIVHGGQASKTGVLRYAPPFHPDYNLVLLDLRNSGQSGGEVSSGGLREELDLRAMIDWLERTKHPTWIAVMGNSNGASTALAEARTDERVRALILDSMHAEIELQVGSVIEGERGLPPWPAAIALVAGAEFRLDGDLRTVDPIRTISQVRGRPMLLTHGSLDDIDRPSESVERTVAAAIDAGIDVEFHLCVGAGHGEVVEVCRVAWASWVTTFLAAHGSGA